VIKEGHLTTSLPDHRLQNMEVRVTATPEQEAFIQECIASGRFASPEDITREALDLWQNRERRRAEILASLDAAEASLDRGEGRRLESPEAITRFIEEVKRRGRSRLA
jgi:putative addiction module CopG family antidote